MLVCLQRQHGRILSPTGVKLIRNSNSGCEEHQIAMEGEQWEQTRPVKRKVVQARRTEGVVLPQRAVQAAETEGVVLPQPPVQAAETEGVVLPPRSMQVTQPNEARISFQCIFLSDAINFSYVLFCVHCMCTVRLILVMYCGAFLLCVGVGFHFNASFSMTLLTSAMCCFVYIVCALCGWFYWCTVVRFYRTTACEAMQCTVLLWAFCLSVRPSICQTRALWQYETIVCQDMNIIRKRKASSFLTPTGFLISAPQRIWRPFEIFVCIAVNGTKKFKRP